MTLNRISTGIEGLDEILSGGLIAHQAYLIKGQPGSGKTTLGFHFLNAAESEGETSLFISFSESETRLRRNAKLIGVDLDQPDDDLQFMSDGVIELHSNVDKRCIQVNKFRGSGFVKGHHDLELSDRGMEVFPRLVPVTYQREFNPETISAGIPEIDELLHGGIERGTTTIISGPSGVGKSTLGMQFMKEGGEESVR